MDGHFVERIPGSSRESWIGVVRNGGYTSDSPSMEPVKTAKTPCSGHAVWGKTITNSNSMGSIYSRRVHTRRFLFFFAFSMFGNMFGLKQPEILYHGALSKKATRPRAQINPPTPRRVGIKNQPTKTSRQSWPRRLSIHVRKSNPTESRGSLLLGAHSCQIFFRGCGEGGGWATVHPASQPTRFR